MDTILKIEHIYGQELYSPTNTKDFTNKVKLVFDGSFQNNYYEKGSVIEIDDMKLKVDDIRIQVVEANLIVTIHVQDV